MGQKANQSLASAAQFIHQTAGYLRPPQQVTPHTSDSLPAASSPIDAPPPPYHGTESYNESRPFHSNWSSRDPRSSSTQSLVQQQPVENDSRRRLLLIWIHGYMGSEVSFKSFPAHVHNAVSQRLQSTGGTHTVHTKIYPRYESRYRIQGARDAFSEWLNPHENQNTDIILLGHSLGGILAAEVALKPAITPQQREYQHRILGTINFDTPFLGMHPGIVTSGIASLFRPASKPPVRESPYGQTNSSFAQSTESNSALGKTDNQSAPRLSSPSVATAESSNPPLTSTSSIGSPNEDPNYDPPYPNDVQRPRRNAWESIGYFINKHSEDLAKAALRRLDSQMQFASCVTDHVSLKNRYAALMALENARNDPAVRVRFVNYYTASTGRPKRPKSPNPKNSQDQNVDREGNDRMLSDADSSLRLPASGASTASESPRISVENVDDVEASKVSPTPSIERLSLTEGKSVDETTVINSSARQEAAPHEVQGPALSSLDSLETGSESKRDVSGVSENSSEPSQETLGLPPLPPELDPPSPFDPAAYPDKDARKIVEKEHAREMKVYEHALRDYQAAIKNRQKYALKREAAAKKAHEKQSSKDEKERIKREKDAAKKEAKEQAKAESEAAKQQAKEEKRKQKEKEHGIQENDLEAKPRRDRKFCALPPRLSDGQRTPLWARVFMPDIDEVEAHCALFDIDGERYIWFVEDVSDRIMEWIASNEDSGMETGVCG